MKKQPEQTAATKQSMIDAFWELAMAQGIDKVTISGITKKAGLNRGTFYVYFADMPDLIAQAEDDIILGLKEQMRNAVSEGGFSDFRIMAAKMLGVFADCDDKLFLLIGKNGDPIFKAVVQSEAAKFLNEVYSPLENIPNSDFIAAYITSAFMGLLTYWHDSGKKISVTDLGEILHTMATQGISGVIPQS